MFILKELGEYLKEKRQENGVSVEETAEDLNVSKDDIENIEEGNVRAFKDVLKLKEIVRNYAKYLGLDQEKIVDEFNDFLFEHTSKISLDDILEAQKRHEEEEKKIISPYTKITRKRLNVDNLVKLKPLFLTLIIILLLLLTLFIYIINISNRKPPNRSSELMDMRREINELA